jgi:endonuclease YncB( thermonuclease family)
MLSLEDATKDVEEFSLCGLTLKGKVVELYDADTCKIVLPVQNNFYKFTCRLTGIDTPEMKPRKDKPNRDNEILLAKQARSELLKLICGENDCLSNINISKQEIINELQKNRQLVTVKCYEFDKYGRLLVDLFSSNNHNVNNPNVNSPNVNSPNSNNNPKSFNTILVEKNMAVVYDGGTKINPWT